MNKIKKQKVEEQEVDREDSMDDDIEYENEQGATALVKKLRERLKACEAEKKEYLDGWQRLKADVANSKKRNLELEDLLKERCEATFVSEIIPVLDSFDMAFRGEAWERVDPIWRTGVEQIHTQLLNILTAHGYEVYGTAGDTFDPLFYEAVSHTKEEGGASNTVTEVLRRGYKKGKVVIRPAQVSVHD